jgi:hypothetical protein
VVYLSTALSLYNFSNSKLRPAPLKLDIKKETSRDRIFSQQEIEFKNMHLRRAVEAISKEIKIVFIDTTESMAK